MLTVGSLFSGIGGLERGLEATGGFKTIWQCEIDPYASAVLKKHWPEVPNLGDITKVRWEDVKRPDVICGGFPCQDISVAGKGAGIKEGTRSGLWSEYAKAIRILRPKYALIENVSILTKRGLDIVLSDLAKAGYDAEWRDIRASDVGAPHRRERESLLLPTPTNSTGIEYIRGNKTLKGALMLPTPNASDASQGAILTENSKVIQKGNRLRILRACGDFGLSLPRALNVSKALHESRSLTEKVEYLNPSFAEAMMGFPVGYTELSASETQSFRKLRKLSEK